LIAVLSGSIFVCEAAINQLLPIYIHWAGWISALANASVLIIVTLPLLYYFAFRPLNVLTSRLRNSEERYRDTFDRAAIGIAHVSPAGNFLHLNDRWCEIVGYTREELMAISFQALTHPDDIHNSLTHLRALLANERREFSTEKRYLRKNGETIWVNLTVSLVRESTGAPSYFISVVEDITQRKHVEEALAESEQKHRSLFETMSQGVIYFNDQGTILSANPAAEQILGMCKEDLHGKFFLNTSWHVVLENGAEISEADHPVAVAARTGKPVVHSIVGILNQQTHTRQWLSIAAVPLFHPGEQKLFQIYSTFEDITNRMRTEKEIADALNYGRTIVETSPIGIITFDENGNAISANPAAAMIAGTTVEQLLTQNYRSLESWKRSGMLGAADSAFTSGQEKSIEVHHLSTFGKETWVSARFVPFTYKGRKNLLSLLSDITERKRAEEDVRRSEGQYRQLFDQMLSGLIVCEVIYDESGKPNGHKFVSANLSFEKLTGFSIDFLIGKTNLDVDTGWPPEVAERFYTVAMTGEPIEYERFNETLGRYFETRVFSPRRGQFANIFTDITERKRAEKALRESEERYRNLFDNAPVGVLQTNSEGKISRANNEFAHILGYADAEEVKELVNGSTSVASLYLPPDRRVHLMKQALQKPGTWIHAEELLRKKDGGTITAKLTIRAIPEFDDQVEGFVEDITERTIAETQLSKLSLAVEQSPTSIFITDVHGNIEYANPKFSQVTGYSLEEILGKNPRILKSGEMPDNEYKRLWETIMAGKEWRGEFHNKKKNGDLFWESASISPVKNADSVITNIVAVKEDITERKQAEETKREDNLMLELAMNAAEMAWWKMHIPTGSISFERRKAEMLGFPPEQFHHYKDFMALIHPDDYEKTMNAMRQHFDGTKDKYEAEYRIMTKSGEYKWFYDVGRIMRKDPNGKPLSVAGLVINISKRKYAEEALRQAQKLESIGSLAGGIAHDFNNVLGGIMGYTDMSLRYAEKDSILEKNLLKVLKATDRAKQLIQQILTFSRKANPHKSVIFIKPIIMEVLELLKASIPSSVIIESVLHKNTRPVLADPVKIHEALLNLATNAVHAMDRKGTLMIRLYSEHVDRGLFGHTGEITPGEYSVIQVSDTGCGMDTITLSKAFEPFFTTKAVGEGTGMGLSVVLGVVQLIGGDIRIGTEVGIGTTFKLYLPASDEVASSASIDDDQTSLHGTERILFVDDEQMLMDTAIDLLTSLGYNVTGIGDSIQALSFMQEHGDDIDVLITDQTMPGMSGLELAKEVLAVRKDMPIILCTGFSNELNPDRAAAIGVKHIVMKPFRYNEIAKIIREVINNRK